MTKILALILSTLMVVVIAPSDLMAQQQEQPLRLVYINTSGAEGRQSYRTVEELLRGSEQIELIGSRAFVRRARQFGIDDRTLGDWGRWPELVDEFAASMWEAEAEGLLIHRVEGDGEKMFITVFGPMGWELDEVEYELEGGELDEGGAVEVLRGAFSALVPEVRGFRRDVSEGRISDEDFEIPDEERPEDQVAEQDEEDSELSARDRAIAEHRRRYGDLGRNVAIRVGLLTGQRSLKMNQIEDTFDLHHHTGLMGIALRGDGLITTIERDTAAFEAGVLFGFSTFATRFGDDELGGRFFRIRGEGRYINSRSETTRLRVIAGLETINISLDPNDHYTGHGYLLGRVGGGIHYSIGNLMTLRLDALFLPTLVSSNSGGAYGDAQGWLGFGADAAVDIDIFEPVLFGFFYNFQYFELEYPEPEVLESGAESTDMLHQFMIGVGYRI